MEHPSTFFDLCAQEWFHATGEMHPTGYDYPERERPVYRRRSDGVEGWFPRIGARFKAFPMANP